MDRPGLCKICGSLASSTCRWCLSPVCRNCLSYAGACKACAGGKKAGSV